MKVSNVKVSHKYRLKYFMYFQAYLEASGIAFNYDVLQQLSKPLVVAM